MQTFFQNGDEQINGAGDPDLGAHRVERRAVKGFDAQMLLEPFEEQFDLPAAPIELGDGHARNAGNFRNQLRRYEVANLPQKVALETCWLDWVFFSSLPGGRAAPSNQHFSCQNQRMLLILNQWFSQTKIVRTAFDSPLSRWEAGNEARLGSSLPRSRYTP